MKTKNISVDILTAMEWYQSDNETLKRLALQAFPEEELKVITYREIEMALPGSQVTALACTTNNMNRMITLNKLYNIATVLNDGWVKGRHDVVYVIAKSNDGIVILNHTRTIYPLPYFKTRELAMQAVQILQAEINNLF